MNLRKSSSIAYSLFETYNHLNRHESELSLNKKK